MFSPIVHGNLCYSLTIRYILPYSSTFFLIYYIILFILKGTTKNKDIYLIDILIPVIIIYIMTMA